MNLMLTRIETLHDYLHNWWESKAVEGGLTWVLVTVFVMGLAGIWFKKLGLLPQPLAAVTPDSSFAAVNLAFTMLLVYEVVALILALAYSVSISLGIQFQILSLILLRQSFKGLSIFGYPFSLEGHMMPLLHLVSNAMGALAIFGLLVVYYRLQRRRRTITSERSMRQFIAHKKAVSLLLFLAFIVSGVYTGFQLSQGHPEDAHGFFARFFTVLIFSDILVMLIALRYQPGFTALFRNSGYALATLLIRLSLVAPPFFDAALGIVAILFAIGLTVAYNAFHAPRNDNPDCA